MFSCKVNIWFLTLYIPCDWSRLNEWDSQVYRSWTWCTYTKPRSKLLNTKLTAIQKLFTILGFPFILGILGDWYLVLASAPNLLIQNWWSQFVKKLLNPLNIWAIKRVMHLQLEPHSPHPLKKMLKSSYFVMSGTFSK